jgi:probable rRNA maturation factor
MEDDPSYDIDVTREGEPGDFGELHIQPAVESALRRHDCPQATLDIALMDDARIAELNERYLGHSGPTDVLSFDLNPNDQEGIDGQIAVSVETARREAQRRGHCVEAEVLLYCIHGTLHLLGYDDLEPADAQRMHEMEDLILRDLGLGSVHGGTAR